MRSCRYMDPMQTAFAVPHNYIRPDLTIVVKHVIDGTFELYFSNLAKLSRSKIKIKQNA